MAPSRKEHAPGIAGGAVHERLKRVALHAGVRTGPETGSMRYTCTNSLHKRLGRTKSIIVLCKNYIDRYRWAVISAPRLRAITLLPFFFCCTNYNVHTRVRVHSGVRAIVLARALFAEQCMDGPREAWIQALHSSIHGLSESMLCAQHIYQVSS